MNRLIRPLYILVPGLVSILVSCGDKQTQQQAPPPPVQVTTYQVQRGEATSYDEYPAAVTPLKMVELRAMASGYVAGIYFEDGQRIKKGQRLYKIDQQQYQASVDQSVAQLRVAEANERRAQREAERYTALDKQEAIAKQVLDNALADLETAQMQVRAARAAVDQSRTGLNYSTINAPFAGTIGISQVRLGALVTQNQTLLNTLSTDNPMAVDFEVNQKEIVRFTALLQQGNGQDSTFTLALPDGSLYPHPGKIDLIDRAVNPQTGTIKVRLIFPNPGDLLKVGMTVNVRVKSTGSGASLLIPNKAVMEQMGEFFVYVVQGDSVRQQLVQLGNVVGDQIVVREGISENTPIVTEGIQKLRNGSKIQATPGSR
ncbi:efflux RND transporter periplasmic adaptor subunit [Telluribacter sp.]|jgi:membrane fusion protein (multidrug efflux system)|uniref:efflux RND transporter periplasmic adaptor subunit n=1 Tax=Telluribacter sp. TaxID=1978767 RepID=UPI002E0E3CEE|nr:efflux RND transporter periplasmic adaptor subunit [Telluribacter sp.]